MTIEALEHFRGMSAEVKAIQDEIDTLYSPVSSPVMSDSHAAAPSNPTEKSAMRIIELKKLIEHRQGKLSEELEVIEKWLVTLDDYELCSIVRWHYLLGLSWKQTNIKVYGYPSYDYSRKRIRRYFGKE